jgi:hypothetical protein
VAAHLWITSFSQEESGKMLPHFFPHFYLAAKNQVKMFAGICGYQFGFLFALTRSGAVL